MRNRYDRQLSTLNEMLIRMGSTCEDAISQVALAMQGKKENAFEGTDADITARIIEKVHQTESEIDQMEKDIERLCLKLLLQQQPVARDLRQISAALKMITDMERIGDQTADIAEIIISAGMSEAGDVKKIEEMSAGVARMVNDSVTAYVERDLELARKVMEADDNIDGLFDDIRRSIINLIAEGNRGEQGVDLIMIAKYLERIGDHATNIAEWVEFSITGVHKGTQAVEA